MIVHAALIPPPALPAECAQRVTPESIVSHVESLVSFGTRHTLSAAEGPRGIGAARRWIHDRLAQWGEGTRLTATFESFEAPPGARLPRPVEIVNIVAVLSGTMPEAASRRYYVVGHYDSRASDPLDAEADAPGANDDASGVAVVMEAARVLATEKLDSTIVFLATAGEEQGLVGAAFHASQARTRAENIAGVLNCDIVGDPDGNGEGRADGRTRIRVFSEGLPRNPTAQQLAEIRAISAECDSPSRQLARYILDVGRWHGLPVQAKLIFRPDRFLRGGDHSAFNEAGFSAVRFTAPFEDYDRQHQDVREERVEDGFVRGYGDIVSEVDGEYLANVARLNIATLVHLANGPSTPGRVRLITANLTTETQVRWDAPPEPDVAGYEVLVRDTTAALWEQTIDVGNVLEWTLPQSKDNIFVGVRAYDRDGYRSVAGFAGASNE